MDFVIDLDHLALRLTIGKAFTNQVLTEAYRTLARLAAHGGPYPGIVDCSKAEEVNVSSDTIQFPAG